MNLDGLLIVDKPVGPSSHDVVARVRRALGERRIGHTGTLDPDASGVLPLVIGKATRLARFLSASDKSYDAVVRLGFATTTYDAAGRPLGRPHDGPWPDRAAVAQALDAFRGTFMQQPPVYSAKKIAGQPSYRRARQAERRAAQATAAQPTADQTTAEQVTAEQTTGAAHEMIDAPVVSLSPVQVTTTRLELVGVDGDRVSLQVDCSAGFYVRSLAHDLGTGLGMGAHLVALRRTRSGDAGILDAVDLASIENAQRGLEQPPLALVPLSRMLPSLPSLSLTEDGLKHTGHGRDLAPGDFVDPGDFADFVDGQLGGGNLFRLMDSLGNLVALAQPSRTRGFLHPFVVLM